MDPLEGFTYRGSFSNLQAALEEHQVSASVGEIVTSPHQQDNIIVKEHYDMEEIRDSLAQAVESAEVKLHKIVTHRRKILRIDKHWQEKEDQLRNTITHGRSLVWAIDGTTTQENENGTAS